MTGAVVLVGVAVSAVTGCVTVRGETAPRHGPDAGPSRPERPGRDGGEAEPGPSAPELRQEPSRPLPQASRSHGPSAARAGDPGARSPSGGGADGGGSDRGGPDGGAPGGAAPGTPPVGGGAPGDGPVRRAPAVRPSALRELPGGAGVCDLGREYGGWAAGSTPTEACERAYGS